MRPGVFDRFVGLPYRDYGRAMDGVDCYGLVFLVHRACGNDLPVYHGRYALGADRRELAQLIAGELGSWRGIAAGSEAPLDLVIMREGALETHVGVVTRPGRLLHIERGVTSRIEPYRTGVLRHRVTGFFRFAG